MRGVFGPPAADGDPSGRRQHRDPRHPDRTSEIDGIEDWALALPGPASCTWVVHIHGHGSSGDQIFTRPDIRQSWLPVYLRHGFGVLSVNLRGNAWMSPAAAADLHALLRWARFHYRVRRLLLVSGSMGGTSNLIYATRYPEDVAGVVALCPATDLASYEAWCRRQEGPPVLREIADAIRTAYEGDPARPTAMFHAHSTLARADALTMPVYVVHGDADTIIPVSQSRSLAMALHGRSSFRYVELPGGDHELPLRHMEAGLAWILDRLSPVSDSHPAGKHKALAR